MVSQKERTNLRIKHLTDGLNTLKAKSKNIKAESANFVMVSLQLSFNDSRILI